MCRGGVWLSSRRQFSEFSLSKSTRISLSEVLVVSVGCGLGLGSLWSVVCRPSIFLVNALLPTSRSLGSQSLNLHLHFKKTSEDLDLFRAKHQAPRTY